MKNRFRIRWLCLIPIGLMCLSCGSVQPLFGPDFPVFSSSSDPTGYRQPPAQAYAGEVLAYMMQVVLGRAGEPSMRKAWRETGLGVELNLETVSALLHRPGTEKQSVMVMDADVFALSKVLYTYAPRLNQFKGQAPFFSPYPSAELVALRLLLLKKQAAGEKMALGRIMERETLISDPEKIPSTADCTAMNLTPKEVRLLQAVFSAEPELKAYLKNPFLVAALYRMGLLKMDPAVRHALASAHYPADSAAPTETGAIEIVLLPSFIGTFHFGDDLKSKTSTGFSADREYLDAVEAFRHRLEAAIMKSAGERQVGKPLPQLNSLLDRVVFRHLAGRPLAVYPENADEVIEAVCPQAEIAVIFLGNDVYRSFTNGAELLGRLDAHRIFLDILDVKYQMVDDEIRRIANRILDRLQQK